MASIYLSKYSSWPIVVLIFLATVADLDKTRTLYINDMVSIPLLLLFVCSLVMLLNNTKITFANKSQIYIPLLLLMGFLIALVSTSLSISTVGSSTTVSDLFAVLRLFVYLVIFVSLSGHGENKDNKTMFVYTFCAGCIAATLINITRQYLGIIVVPQTTIGTWGLPSAIDAKNLTGASLGASCILCSYIFWTNKSNVSLLMTLLSGVLTLVTWSFGAWALALAGLSVVLVSICRIRFAIRLLVHKPLLVLLMLFLGLLLITNQYSINLYSKAKEVVAQKYFAASGNDFFAVRIHHAKVALVLGSNKPIFGNGRGNFLQEYKNKYSSHPEYQENDNPHGAYQHIVYSYGYICLLVHVVILLLLYRIVFRHAPGGVLGRTYVALVLTGGYALFGLVLLQQITSIVGIFFLMFLSTSQSEFGSTKGQINSPSPSTCLP